MKTKRLLVASSITTLVLIIISVSLKAYYVAFALIVGALIISHRELWSSIRRGKLPPADERVRGNINKSIRNSFIFFATVSVLTILFYITNQYDPIRPGLEYFLGGLLLSVGIIYMVSYIFYDRVEANLNDRWSKIFRTFLLLASVSLFVFVIDAFFINTIIDVTLHMILLYVSLFVFAMGTVGSTIIFIKGLIVRS